MLLPNNENRGPDLKKASTAIKPIYLVLGGVSDGAYRQERFLPQFVLAEQGFRQIIGMFEIGKSIRIKGTPVLENSGLPLSFPAVKTGIKAGDRIPNREEEPVLFWKFLQCSVVGMFYDL